jgi:hypothetical protein
VCTSSYHFQAYRTGYETSYILVNRRKTQEKPGCGERPINTFVEVSYPVRGGRRAAAKSPEMVKSRLPDPGMGRFRTSFPGWIARIQNAPARDLAGASGYHSATVTYRRWERKPCWLTAVIPVIAAVHSIRYGTRPNNLARSGSRRRECQPAHDQTASHQSKHKASHVRLLFSVAISFPIQPGNAARTRTCEKLAIKTR